MNGAINNDDKFNFASTVLKIARFYDL